MAPAVPRRPMAAPLVRYELTEAGRAALEEDASAGPMTDASMLDVQTAVYHTRDVLVVESVVDAARTTHGQTSITPRGVVVTLTCRCGPLAAPGLMERVVFTLAPDDLDTLVAAIRAAVDEAHRQGDV